MNYRKYVFLIIQLTQENSKLKIQNEKKEDEIKLLTDKLDELEARFATILKNKIKSPIEYIKSKIV